MLSAGLHEHMCNNSGQRPQRNIRHTALNLLARREHAEAELQIKLARKGFADIAIRETLDQLIRENLLSTRRFAENYVNYRHTRGVGPLRIREELRMRGVEAEEIDTLLNFQDEIWFQAARRARIKRFSDAPPASPAEKAKQMRFLQGRGFTREQTEYSFLTESRQ